MQKYPYLFVTFVQIYYPCAKGGGLQSRGHPHRIGNKEFG